MNSNSQAWHFACIRDRETVKNELNEEKKKKKKNLESEWERDCQWKKIIFEIDNIAHNRKTTQKLNKYVGHDLSLQYRPIQQKQQMEFNRLPRI